jgi:hypothetical protein
LSSSSPSPPPAQPTSLTITRHDSFDFGSAFVGETPRSTRHLVTTHTSDMVLLNSTRPKPPNLYDFVMPEQTPTSATQTLGPARKFTFAVKAGLPQKSRQTFVCSLNSTKSLLQGAPYTRTRASNMTATNWDDIDVRSLALPPLSDFVDHHRHLFGRYSQEAVATKKDLPSAKPVSFLPSASFLVETTPCLLESVVTAHPHAPETTRRHSVDPKLSPSKHGRSEKPPSPSLDTETVHMAAARSVVKQLRVNVSTWNVLSSEVIKEGYLAKHTEHSGPCTSLK